MSVNAAAMDKDEIDSIGHLIDRLAANQPDSTYLVDPESGNALTFAELKEKTARVGAFIEARGVKPGQAVAYAMTNSLDSVVTILGIMSAGYLATAINLVAGNSVISYVLEHSEATLVIVDDHGGDLIEAALTDIETSVQTASMREALESSYVSQSCPAIGAKDAALLMYTSGTTGRPKGVVLSHDNLIAGGENSAGAHELSSVDRGLCVLPLYHINCLCVTVMGALVSGGSLAMPPKFSVSKFWNIVVDSHCTWFSVVPTQISYLLQDHKNLPNQDDLAHVRFGRSASAPLSPDVQEAFENRFGIAIVETMGLTETSAQILSNPLPPGIRKIGSPGKAFGNDIMICDERQNGVAVNTVGEVLVRGRNVMQYYLKNEAATAESITNDGWLRTGDLGRMDGDGYVFITGRLKELIIKGGENIAPREVDDALYSHQDVIEAAAYGRSCERYGETVEAAVKVRDGSALNEADLIEICRKALGAFKAPERVHFLDDLPKGPSGKIQRIKLAEILGS